MEIYKRKKVLVHGLFVLALGEDFQKNKYHPFRIFLMFSGSFWILADIKSEGQKIKAQNLSH